MPNAAINALTAPDAVTNASTIDPGRQIDRVIIDVANQGIYRALKEFTGNLSPAAGYWGGEVYQAPGSRVVTRSTLCGVRFRAAIPAAQLPAGQSQAVVTVEAVFS